MKFETKEVVICYHSGSERCFRNNEIASQVTTCNHDSHAATIGPVVCGLKPKSLLFFILDSYFVYLRNI